MPQAVDVAEQWERAGIRGRANVLADALEAILGALFLDGGLEPARRLVRKCWKGALTAQTRPPKDPKTALQEWVLARGLALPVYETVSADGPSLAPNLVVDVHAAGLVGAGQAGRKRVAARAAESDLVDRTTPAPGIKRT